MCFHSKQSKKAQTVEKRFNATVENITLFESQTEFNGFSYPKTPIITNTNTSKVQLFNWGLIPKWSNNIDIRQYTLNARIETIKEKASFKHNIKNRCLIIADGFYEWKWLDNKGKNKQKHLISLPNNELYAYAGIYDQWINEDTGEIINSYAIITTEANELMAEIHRKKRMPVILNPEDEINWLKGDEIDNYKFPYSVNLVATNLDAQLTL